MFTKTTFGTTPASTSFGFGTTNTNSNLFGQSSLFGKPATSGFGTPNTTFGNSAPIFGAPSGSLFPSNTAGTFGANQNQPAFGSNLFGNQQNANTGNLFGSNSNTFGQQNKPVGFGFGTTTSANRLFSQPTTQQTPFQAASTSGLFGASSGFGNTQAGTVIKFNPVTGTDTMQKAGVATNINTKHYCITCMKEYENKSLEELRWEDYQANRKGPQQQAGFGVAFGNTATSSSQPLFGQTTDNKSAFGQTTAFNQSSGFGLGNQTGATGSLFGKPNTTFGTTTTSSGFGFNNPTVSNPFSTNPTQPFAQSKPLFGTTSTPSSGFGNTNMFGQTGAQPAQSTVFGQTQTSGFNPSAGFGQMAQNQTGLFQTSKPATSFGPFSQTITSAPSFGQQTGTFGQTNAFNTFGKPGQSTFGNPQGSFGSTLGSQANGNLFGNLQQKPGGFFGNTNSTGLFSGGTTFQPNISFNMMNMKNQIPNMNQMPEMSDELKTQLQSADTFGRSKVLTGLTPLKEDDNKRTTNPRELKVILDCSAKVKLPSPIKTKPNMSSVSSSMMDVFEGALGKNDYDSQRYNKMTGKRLVIRKKGSVDILRSSNSDTSLFDFEGDDDVSRINSSLRKLERSNGFFELNADNSENRISVKPITNGTENANNSLEIPWLNANQSVNNNEDIITNGENSGELRVEKEKLNAPETEEAPKHPCGITLTRPEYYTIPSLDELPNHLKSDGTCVVKGFTIGRVCYGNVYYPDAFDVSNLNLDKIIFFRQGEIIVYPDESTTPPVGQGLNRKAQVTLDKVWPKTKDGSIVLKDLKDINAINFVDKLQQICEKRKSQFVEYRPETGSWVFKVDHFSKHGFSDSDEEDVSEKVLKFRDRTFNGDVRRPKQKGKEVEEVFKTKQQLEVVEKPSKESLLLPQDNGLSLHLPDSMEIFAVSETLGLGGFQLDSLQSSSSTLSSDDFSSPDKTESSPSLRASRHYIYKEVEPIQLSLMKCSFFDDQLSEIIDSESEEAHSPELLKLALDEPIEFSVGQVEHPKQVERPKLTYLLPKTFKLRGQPSLIPTEKIVLNNHRNCKDMSVFLGRSFKVGWSIGNILTNVSSSSTCNYQVKLSNLASFTKNNKNSFYYSLIDHVKIVQSNSISTVDGSEVPTLQVLHGHDIVITHEKLVNSFLNRRDFQNSGFYYSCIWNLLATFWTPQAFHTKRDVFSNWLKRTVTYDVHRDISYHAELESGDNDIKATCNKIFALLSGHRIEQASKLALKFDMPQLSLQISQLNTVNFVSAFAEKQFSQWQESGIAKYIDKDLLKIYMLLMGTAVHKDINICDSLDWKRALGIHLWYICPVEYSISRVLKTYKTAFNELCYSKKPYPPHKDLINYSSSDKYDLLYHIINLYVHPYGSLHHVLEPSTYTGNPLDYSLSWLLLKTFEAIGVGKIAENASNYIHISFANQLENIGEWQWAIFVLLFLKDVNVKKNLIMKILEQHITCDLTEEELKIEEFLVYNFKIPSDWIHIAKAKKAELAGKHWEAHKHLTLAKQWSNSHDLVFSTIAPDLMIHNDFYLLEKIFENLLPGEKSILDWKIKGGIFYDFVNLWKLINNREEEETEELSLNEIEIDLLDLLGRLKKYPITNSKQALGISECSKFLAFLLKKFYLELQIKSQENIYNFSSCKESLVIPPDYELEELIKSLCNRVDMEMI